MATVGQWIVDTYHLRKRIRAFPPGFHKYGMWIILAKGLTPIPFILVSIASGVTHFNLAIFIFSASMTRGWRFFLEAVLIRKFGQPVQDFIERYMTWIGVSVLAIIIGGVWLVFGALTRSGSDHPSAFAISSACSLLWRLSEPVAVAALSGRPT